MTTVSLVHKAAARSLVRHGSRSMRPSAQLCATRTFSSATAPSGSRLLDESVMEHLVCPISKLPLRYDAARGLIICPEIRVAYPIVDGVPMLVPTEGRLLRDDEEA